jgi:OOP family OmpA-OmpF porin
MKKPLLALLALPALAITSLAHAQLESAYYGLSIGEIDYTDSGVFPGAILADTVSSWRLMVGYQFMEHLGVEGSYGESSTIRDTETVTLPGGTDLFDLAFEGEFSKLLTIRVLGTLPFDNGISLMAGLGYVDFELDAIAYLRLGGETLATGDFSYSDGRPSYYVGAQYDWDRVALRLGYEKFDLDGDVDAEEVSLTFFYKI